MARIVVAGMLNKLSLTRNKYGACLHINPGLAAFLQSSHIGYNYGRFQLLRKSFYVLLNMETNPSLHEEDREKASATRPPSEGVPAQTSDTVQIPDGGLQAWSQVIAAHLVVLNCWGYISS